MNGFFRKTAAGLAAAAILLGSQVYAAEPLRNFCSEDWDLSALKSLDGYAAGEQVNFADGTISSDRAQISLYGAAINAQLVCDEGANSVKLRRTTSGKSRHTNFTYSPKDVGFDLETAVVDFTWRPDFYEDEDGDNYENQFQYVIICSSDNGAGSVSDLGADTSVFGTAKDAVNSVSAGKDGMILVAYMGGLYAVHTGEVKKLADIGENRDINIRAEISDGKITLYSEQGKIGILAKPVMEQASLDAPTGAVPTTLKFGLYTIPTTSDKNVQWATIDNVSYSQKGAKISSAYTQDFAYDDAMFDNKTFGLQNGSAYFAGDEAWQYNMNWSFYANGSKSKLRHRISGYAGFENGALRIGSTDTDLLSGEGLNRGGINVDYKNAALLGSDKVSVSFDWRAQVGETYAQAVTVASKVYYSKENGTGTGVYDYSAWKAYFDKKAYFVQNPDAATLYLVSDGEKSGFYYAADSVMPLAAAFENGKTYRVRFDIDNTASTFDLYIDGEKVAENAALSARTGARPATLQFFGYNNGTEIAASDMYIDNLTIEKRTEAVDNYEPTAELSFYADDANVIADGVLPDAAYVDIKGDDVGDDVILAAYSADGTLLGVQLGSADGEYGARFAYDYDSTDTVKMFNMKLASLTPISVQALTKISD